MYTKSKNSLNPKTRRYSPNEKKTILAEIANGKPITEVSKIFKIHCSTISRWLLMNREKNNTDPISEKHSGHHQHWQSVLDIWKKHPGLGPAQIKNQMHRNGIRISVATVRNILLENGYVPPKAIVKSERIKSYEAIRRMEIVHLDFKHFYINKSKVYLLLLQDDFSRFICGYKMTDSENMEIIIEAFEDCVSKHGKMQIVMTDAGSAFYSWNGINRFQKLVGDEYGIDQIKAGSPRSNGKIESVNKQIEKELLNKKIFASLEEANTGISEWITFYNFQRTHMGLPEGMVPADRFFYQWNTCSVQTKKVGNHSEDKSNNLWEDLIRVGINKLT